MAARRRATLRSAWWKNQIRAVRHCFFCGGTLERKYVAEERCWRLVCSACAQISYMNPKVVAGVIPETVRGGVILLRRSIEPAKGKWTYPAGYQELGETVEEAARRETVEEIGVRIKRLETLGLYSYPDAGVVTVVYITRVPVREKPHATPEALEVREFARNRIPWKDLAFRSTIHAMRDWLAQSKKGKK